MAPKPLQQKQQLLSDAAHLVRNSTDAAAGPGGVCRSTSSGSTAHAAAHAGLLQHVHPCHPAILQANGKTARNLLQDQAAAAAALQGRKRQRRMTVLQPEQLHSKVPVPQPMHVLSGMQPQQHAQQAAGGKQSSADATSCSRRPSACPLQTRSPAASAKAARTDTGGHGYNTRAQQQQLRQRQAQQLQQQDQTLVTVTARQTSRAATAAAAVAAAAVQLTGHCASPSAGGLPSEEGAWASTDADDPWSIMAVDGSPGGLGSAMDMDANEEDQPSNGAVADAAVAISGFAQAVLLQILGKAAAVRKGTAVLTVDPAAAAATGAASVQRRLVICELCVHSRAALQLMPCPREWLRVMPHFGCSAANLHLANNLMASIRLPGEWCACAHAALHGSYPL